MADFCTCSCGCDYSRVTPRVVEETRVVEATEPIDAIDVAGSVEPSDSVEVVDKLPSIHDIERDHRRWLTKRFNSGNVNYKYIHAGMLDWKRVSSSGAARYHLYMMKNFDTNSKELSGVFMGMCICFSRYCYDKKYRDVYSLFLSTYGVESGRDEPFTGPITHKN